MLGVAAPLGEHPLSVWTWRPEGQSETPSPIQLNLDASCFARNSGLKCEHTYALSLFLTLDLALPYELLSLSFSLCISTK